MSKYHTERIRNAIERAVRSACGGIDEPHCTNAELEEIHEHMSFLQEDITMHLSERKGEEDE